jgi:hypothetical protein
MTLYMPGDPVPRDWFTRLDNVEEMYFVHPCIVETTPTLRTIRKAYPILDTPMIYFKHVEGSNGEMNAQFDRETIVMLNDCP